jgi:hypothetical protein
VTVTMGRNSENTHVPSVVASDHHSDGLAGVISSKNAVIIGSSTCTTAEIEM